MDVPDEFVAGHTTSPLLSPAKRTEKSASGRNCRLQCMCVSRQSGSGVSKASGTIASSQWQPVRIVWHLDHRRKHPKLKVSRRQLPLCPYFAITAHAGQGLTMREGAIADIAIRAGDDPLTCYVAVTRMEGHISSLCPGAFPAWACCSENGEEKQSTGRRSDKSTSSRSRAAGAGNARSRVGTRQVNGSLTMRVASVKNT